MFHLRVIVVREKLNSAVYARRLGSLVEKTQVGWSQQFGHKVVRLVNVDAMFFTLIRDEYFRFQSLHRLLYGGIVE